MTKEIKKICEEKDCSISEAQHILREQKPKKKVWQN